MKKTVLTLCLLTSVSCLRAMDGESSSRYPVISELATAASSSSASSLLSSVAGSARGCSVVLEGKMAPLPFKDMLYNAITNRKNVESSILWVTGGWLTARSKHILGTLAGLGLLGLSVTHYTGNLTPAARHLMNQMQTLGQPNRSITQPQPMVCEIAGLGAKATPQ